MDDLSPKLFGIPVGYALAAFALLVAINLVFLDLFLIISPKSYDSAASVTVQTVSPSPSDEPCPAACLATIQEFVHTTSSSSVLQTTLTPTPTQKPSGIAPTTTELFIPFGSGSGAGTDWQDIPGLLATINTANYGQIQTVTFEASLRIPTGNQAAYARLYNVTDKHPVWFSEVSLEGGTPQLLISAPIQLDVGNKTYQVQLKTSLGSLTFIDQARLRIEALK
jgi:hypothetical protein